MKKISKIAIIASIFLGTFLTPIQMILAPQAPVNQQSTERASLVIKIISSQAHAEEALKEPNTKEDGLNYFECSWYNLACWLFNLVYIVAVPVGNSLVALAGLFLDFFLLHSITGTSYRSGFIEQGWEIIRDVTNIFFVFGLLILAFKMVLGLGNAKKSLVNIILVALTINFSLFMSYLIIDTSNIFAHIFYNKIGQTEASLNEGASISDLSLGSGSSIGTESKSLAIAGKVNPQKMTQMANKLDASFLFKLIVVLMAGFINFTLIAVFVKVALLMLGRTVGLFITVVLAPLAFASLIIPGMSNIPYVGFGNWIKDLMKLAFLAPVFLFFLYITVQFTNISIPGVAADANSHALLQILNLLVPMAAIVSLLMLSKTVAINMAGKIGGMIADSVVKGAKMIGKGALVAGGIGFAASMGGASLISRGAGGTLSRVGKWTKSDNLKKAGEWTSRRGRNFGSRKFDVATIPGFKNLVGSQNTKRMQMLTGSSINMQGQKLNQWRKSPVGLWKSTKGEESAAAIAFEKEQLKYKNDKAATPEDLQDDIKDLHAEDALKKAKKIGDKAKKEATEGDQVKMDQLQRNLSKAEGEFDEEKYNEKGSERDTALKNAKAVDPEIEKAEKARDDAINNAENDPGVQKAEKARDDAITKLTDASTNLADAQKAILKKESAPPKPPAGFNGSKNPDYLKEKASHEQEVKDMKKNLVTLESQKTKAETKATKAESDLTTQKATVQSKVTDAESKVTDAKNKKAGFEKVAKDAQDAMDIIAEGKTMAADELEKFRKESNKKGDRAAQAAKNKYANELSGGKKPESWQIRTANRIRKGDEPEKKLSKQLADLIKLSEKETGTSTSELNASSSAKITKE